MDLYVRMTTLVVWQGHSSAAQRIHTAATKRSSQRKALNYVVVQNKLLCTLVPSYCCTVCMDYCIQSLHTLQKNIHGCLH